MGDPQSASQLANGRVIFDAFVQGRDSGFFQTAGTLIVVALVVVAYAVVVGRAHRSGSPFTSRSPRSRAMLGFVGAHAVAIIAITLILAIPAVAALLSRWSADRERLQTGNYAVVRGPIEGLVVTSVGQSRFTSPTNPATEIDALIVPPYRFRLVCTPNGLTAVVGGPGACLNAAPGSRVEVDYIQVTSTTYWPDPLRIILLGP